MPDTSQNPPEGPVVPQGIDNEETKLAKSVSLLLRYVLPAALVIAFYRLWPDFTLQLLIFIAILGVLIFVHEWGHFQFALWSGMKVNRFGMGFPPWVYTKRHKGIDYSIGALPIGGMVDIAGLGSEEEMFSTMSVGTAATNVENVAAEAGEEPGRVEEYLRAPQDKPWGQKLFQDAPLLWRFLTLFAGPAMNFTFAVIVFIGLYTFAGIAIPDHPTNRVQRVTTGSPADMAGIRRGDYFIGVNGMRSESFEKLGKKIKSGDGSPVDILVRRDGKEMSLKIKPVVDEIDVTGAKALVIGVTPEYAFHYEKVGPVEAVTIGFKEAFFIVREIGATLGRLMTGSLSKTEKRGIGGPVKILEAVGESTTYGWHGVLRLAAMLSVNLALMNLLPLPALDGGRILFLGYELVALRPFDPKKEGVVHTVGIAMILLLMLAVTIKDIWPHVEKLVQRFV